MNVLIKQIRKKDYNMKKHMEMITIKTSLVFLILSLFVITGCKKDPGKYMSRFVFLGDTRGDYKTDSKNYLSEKILAKITANITMLKPLPDFVIFNGDMLAKTAYRSKNNSVKLWNSVFLNPLKNKKIKVYITPGNHIIDQKIGGPAEATNYIKLFNRYFPGDNPQNGPDGFKGVTYSFTEKNCHFITTTSFISHRGKDNEDLKPVDFVQKKNDFEYFINRKNRKWLQEDLNKNNCDFTVYFTHCPLYPTGPHVADKKSLHSHPAMRDEVADMLVSGNTDLFLASHEHLYSRAMLGLNNPTSSKLKGNLLQVIVGSASAPLSKKPQRKDMRIDKYLHAYGYLVADVMENRIDCNVYDENNLKIDEFNIYKTKRKQQAD